MKKYLAEFIGTFFLVLAVVLTENNGTGNLAPIAIGAMLMVMIFAGGHVSGGHFNPVVSLAVLLRGKMDKTDFPMYVAAQIAGGAVAALVGAFLLRCVGATEIVARANEPVCALLAEFLGAFALAWVTLNMMTTRANAGNSLHALALGGTFAACIYALGSVSGGAFNPAVAVGISIAGMAAWSDIWLYLLGPSLGAAAAATIFQFIVGHEN